MSHYETCRLRKPLSRSSEFMSHFLRKVIKKIRRNDHEGNNLREALEELIEEEAPSIESDERALIGNVLDLRDLTAQDVMIPRADIIAVPNTISGHELVDVLTKSRVARIAVFSETLDHVLGVVDVKDAVQWMNDLENFVCQPWIREVLFISPAMRTLDLLLLMRETGRKVAIVVDEYGGVDGMVTFAQLIEEIIGDIQEAHTNVPPSQVLLRPDGSIIADARTTLEELDETVGGRFSTTIGDNDIDTLGGWTTFIAGRVPVRGELIRHQSGMEIEILDADPRRVKRLCIRNWHELLAKK